MEETVSKPVISQDWKDHLARIAAARKPEVMRRSPEACRKAQAASVVAKLAKKAQKEIDGKLAK